MSGAPARRFRVRVGRRSRTTGGAPAESVEIFAPDRRCTDLLLEHAAALFPAEIAPGCVWIVRVHPPADERGWATDVLALVQRWLESARLPWATVLFGGCSYLVRPSTDISEFRAVVDANRGLRSLVTS